MTEPWHPPLEIQVVQALNAALAKAQGEFPTIPREKTVKVTTKDGGTYSFAYAPLETIIETVRPILADNGLAVLQLLEPGPALRTEIRHRDGGVISGSFPFQNGGTPQALGSTITYLRRYALVAMLGLATEEDDDGQAAASTPTKPATDVPMISEAQQRKIGVLLKELEEKAPQTEGQLSWVAQLRERFRVASRKEMTKAQASAAIDWLEEQRDAAEIPFG